MGIKAIASKILAKRVASASQSWINNPLQAQANTFQYLLNKAQHTAFAKDCYFSEIANYEEFREAVKLVEYEKLRPYIDRMVDGEENVLWPGKPMYWSKTSGTTSGAKYIPISKEAISHHIRAARNALLFYINRTGKSAFVDGKMIFLQGSPMLEMKNGIALGRLSGIVAHHVPKYLQRNRMPSWETNCIEDWETKLDAIVEETLKVDMRLISGIPSWVQMYFERLLAKTGKSNILEVFPNFSLFVYGGLNYEPYRPIFESLMGGRVDAIETYPASEGFIAFQDANEGEGLLLNLDADIFYEFVPLKEIHSDRPKRLSLAEVELGENYAIVLNTSSGLWAYVIGDTVRFVSIDPYRIVVTGRIKHFISAFGEHVIAEEVEKAMQRAMQLSGAIVSEFHLAPQVKPQEGLPYHEWFVEFTKEPENLESFALLLDEAMQQQNPYYKDLIQGKILRSAKLSKCRTGSFVDYMRSVGKLGGQNKIPRLADNRIIAEALSKLQNH